MIKSRQNARLKDIRRARICKGEEALIEGPHLVAEALAAGIDLHNILATEDFLAQTAEEDWRRKLPREPLTIAPKLLADVTDSDSPRGIVALARLPRGGAGVLPRREDGVYLVLDGVQDPGNLGALARVAEASGAAGLCTGPGTAHPNHPRALRASAGSLLRLPVAMRTDAPTLNAHLETLAPTWAALATRGGQDLAAPLPQGALIVAVGAEKGLSPSLEERADVAVTIPLEPPVESLNTTVAAALLLFEIRRQRRT